MVRELLFNVLSPRLEPQYYVVLFYCTFKTDGAAGTVGEGGGVPPDKGQVIPSISGRVVVSLQGARPPAMFCVACSR